MSFWAGIKHAINSTLGTDKFQPLDELIKGGTKLVANSGFILDSFSSSESGGDGLGVSSGSNYQTNNFVSFSCGGTVYFSVNASLKSNNSATTTRATITVQKKNESGTWEDVTGATDEYSTISTSEIKTRLYAPAEIEANAVYRISARTSYAKIDFSSIQINAIPISAYLEITKS